MLICKVTCSFTVYFISIILADYSFIVGFQVTSFQFWIASIAANRRSLKPPVMVDAGGFFVAAAIIEDDQTVCYGGRT
jgi:hypothetical protein